MCKLGVSCGVSFSLLPEMDHRSLKHEMRHFVGTFYTWHTAQHVAAASTCVTRAEVRSHSSSVRAPPHHNGKKPDKDTLRLCYSSSLSFASHLSCLAWKPSVPRTLNGPVRRACALQGVLLVALLRSFLLAAPSFGCETTRGLLCYNF